MNKTNPLELKIGDQVVATFSTTLEYNMRGEREVVKRAYYDYAFVTGVVQRYTGTYHKGNLSLWEDHDPPTFTPKKRILLYECRKSINSKPFLASPEDIEKTP